MTTTTDTPNSCPHCAAKCFTVVEWECGTTPILDGDTHRSPLCREREKSQKLEAEVERLRRIVGRVIKIAEEFWDNQKQAVLVYHQELADELDQLKANLLTIQK